MARRGPKVDFLGFKSIRFHWRRTNGDRLYFFSCHKRNLIKEGNVIPNALIWHILCKRKLYDTIGTQPHFNSFLQLCFFKIRPTDKYVKQ